jgi:two-component system sensor histidine kinase UhpB
MVSTTGGEIGVLQSTIVDMATSLHQLRQSLEAKVIARTRDLEIARDEALKSNEEKQRLIKKINTVIEEERKNISVEVHDHLNASLIVTRLEAQNIYDLAENASSSHTADEIKKKATSIIHLSNELYASSRNMIKRLRPEIIDMLGLRAAVEEMVNHYASVSSSCQFTLHAKDDLSSLSSDLAITAYRLIQESLLNSVKHAEAKKVSIRIKLIKNHKTLFMGVSDNGKGFIPNSEVSGIGLIGMKERVASFNGKLKIQSTLAKGSRTLIAIQIH